MWEYLELSRFFGVEILLGSLIGETPHGLGEEAHVALSGWTDLGALFRAVVFILIHRSVAAVGCGGVGRDASLKFIDVVMPMH